MKYGKGNILETSVMKLMPNKTPRKSPTKYSDSGRDVITVKNKPKSLTINQLKDLMNEIYLSKEKQNLTCKTGGLVMETMENHMYTYLNQKYGLKSISV